MNLLSNLGRISWSTHLLVYPSIALLYLWGLKPFMASRSAAAEKKEWDMMPKAKPVDPDLFNPFTPIPYHNNPENTYNYAHIKMFGYLNENHINVNDYSYKLYHNSFDHNSKNEYLYNWISLHGPRN